ncbi:hypothetical protein GGR53DRAFT_414598 [Hypoxylon sp. FL1150]|nr:hypothetical protein GGR53DRAFT_414598 [Hypoxylon sp. FL1150]
MGSQHSNIDRSNVGSQDGHRYDDAGDGDVVPADIGLKDAAECINACYEDFVGEWYEKTEGGFEGVCKQLSQVEPNTELWGLYCCNSDYCGVRADVQGKDPSVDLIINQCQSLHGDYLIYDPGPPPNDSTCKSFANSSDPGNRGVLTISSSSGPSATATETATSSFTSPATTTWPSSVLNSTMSGAGVAPSESTGLTEGSKAAIGICASLAIIAIIFLVGFMISRRRSRPQSYFDGAPTAPRHGRSFSEPPSGSRTPLITPPPSASSKGPPLTPPLRLSDRRFLPSLLKQGGTTDSSLAFEDRIYPHAAFGLPPEKGVLRHERRATTSSIHNSPFSPSHPAAVHFAPQILRDSASSYSSGPGGASTATIGSHKAGSVRSGATGASPLLQPLSPSRPQRSYDERLESPHLATPAGPPPNRALPAPPPYHPVSPTFTVSPISPSASPGLPAVRPLALSENKGHVETSSAIASPLPKSTKDLSDLTESYARQTSESWGSWSGTGGGGPGVSIGGGKKRGHGNNSRSRDNLGGGGEGKKGSNDSTVSLQELDLEKLGGKY